MICPDCGYTFARDTHTSRGFWTMVSQHAFEHLIGKIDVPRALPYPDTSDHLTPEQVGHFSAQMSKIREAIGQHDSTMANYRAIGYIEGLHDGMWFGATGERYKRHSLTLNDYEKDFCR